MIKLITDSGTLYTPKEALEKGFVVNPLHVTINNVQYTEYEDIEAEEFVKIIEQGHIPTSSQPSVGRLTDELEKCKKDDVIVLTMADGLSGTYQSCELAKNNVEDNEKIRIINTKTLCGPQRYLVEVTQELINKNETLENILKMINEKIETTESFLLPQDFQYLKRGGRLTPLAATLAGLFKIQPIIKQTADGMRLDKFDMCRNFKISINKIIDYYKDKLTNNHIIYISHAFNEEGAIYAKNKFLEAFKDLRVEILELSCAFITQGGPKCIAIQSIEA